MGVQILLFGLLSAIGLGAPVISDWLQGLAVKERVRAMLLPSILIGLIAAGILVIGPAISWIELCAVF